VDVDGPLTSDPTGLAGEWGLMRPSGVGFVRAAIYWRDFEAQPGVDDLASTDALVLDAARRGLPLLPVVLGTPRWARLDPENDGSPPADPATFAHALQVLAQRYGPAGSLWAQHPEVVPRPIRAWQIWNEPNLPGYWSRQPFATAYVALLRAARQALRAVDPGAQVILAGLPNKSWLALRAIYQAGGRGTFDAIALHPYTSHVRYIVSIVRLARQEAIRAHDGRVPIWLTEVSWPAAAGHDSQAFTGFVVTDRGQASRLSQTFTALAKVRRKLGIARVVWYTWLSAEGRTTPKWAGYAGLRRVRSNGTIVSSPALKAFRQTVARLRAPAARRSPRRSATR
jgi:polysaccharide biosynthesis protein PslG